MIDLTYTQDGMFTRFVAWTDNGEYIWREIAKENNGVAAVLNSHAQDVINQIRGAGYTVKKSKPTTANEIDRILAELED